MIEAFAVADVYAAEAALLATLPDGELMSRAVTGLTEVALARLATLGGRRVVALVGPGNNGADALYAAARLAALGFPVGAMHLPDKVHDGAYAAARDAGVVLVAGVGDEAAAVVAEADLVLDGIVGIGGRPGVPTFAREWIAAIGDTAYVIAVDLPSGQDPAGEVLDGAGVFADETVTFGVPKPVHLLPATEATVGLLTVIDIGVVLDTVPAVRRLGRGDVASLWPIPGPGDDKYSRGVVGVIAGGERYSGAAVLTCTSAAGAGAGMIRYIGTSTPEALVRAAVPEAVPGPGRVQAWVIGPGLDPASETGGASAQLTAAREALASSDPAVVDAGGLDLIRAPREAPTLLTPHAGECAALLTRLGPKEIRRADVSAAPLSHARELAERTGATVLLKGATTLVVSPMAAEPVYSQADAPAWLATAGAGDVLAGLAGTLLAAGLAPGAAGALAALVHGVAADEANPGGPVRALAVANAIPSVVARLLR